MQRAGAIATPVLACMTFPKEHRAKLHSSNPIERLNGGIKHRTDVVGIFPPTRRIPDAGKCRPTER